MPIRSVPASTITRFAALLLFALLTRAGTLGDPNFHDDELFYLFVGHRMQDGWLAYVDIWDRKPPGLFLLYAGIAALGPGVLAYQIAAAFAAALTALVIAALADRLGPPRPATFAGLLYLALLPLLGGRGGQVAVFMNLLTALAAWLVLAHRERLRHGVLDPAVVCAIALLGVALTLKQTAIAEGLFLGSVVLWQLSATPAYRLRAAALLAFGGAAPFLAFAAYYAASGHFDAFWHAMVTANLAKAYNPSHDLLARAGAVAMVLAPAWLLALGGLIGHSLDPTRRFLLGWLIAACIGAALVPNLLDHYALPVLVPLAALAAPWFARSRAAALIGLAAIAVVLAQTGTFDFARANRSATAMQNLVARIKARDPHPALLVYDGPVWLYQLTGSLPPSPLALPFHLSYAPERNTSPLDTAPEFRRILSTRPSVVVIRRREPSDLLNAETRAAALAYVAHCRWHFDHRLLDSYGWLTLDIHGGCR